MGSILENNKIIYGKYLGTKKFYANICVCVRAQNNSHCKFKANYKFIFAYI